MDRIKRLWVLLSRDSVCCCNEPVDRGDTGATAATMDPDLFSQLVARASSQGWRCIIVADRRGVPQALNRQLDRVKHLIVVPADYEGEDLGAATDIAFNCEQACLGSGPSEGKAVLRVTQGDLEQLATCVIQLLDRYADVSIRHPDLLKYTMEDFETYRQQLHELGGWLLSKGSAWPDFRVDVLTDRFRLNGVNECGAGNTSLAVSPDGRLYSCPAAFRGGFDSCGHIATGLKIANRHLFTREYALPCGEKCDALHCSRCVFLNKLATYEFCVPAENVCRVAHVELQIQAWLANEAVKRECWNSQEWKVPATPIIDDPFQLVRANEDLPDMIWQRLLLFTGHPENLSPSMMLWIIYTLQGKLDAISSCVNSGYVLPSDLIEDNVLLSLRRKTVERYKDVVFEKGCPTVHEIEILLDRMAEALIEHSSPELQRV